MATSDRSATVPPGRPRTAAAALPALVCVLAAMAWADPPPPGRVLAPTLGRPAIVAPGATFTIVADVRSETQTITLTLTPGSRAADPVIIPLDAGQTAQLLRRAPLEVRVPPETPLGVYDLSIDLGPVAVAQPHCVAVSRLDGPVRIVALGSMNVGDLTAPGFDRRLASEINLLAPDVVIAAGDYLDAAHPDPARGWRELVDFVKRLRAAVVLACGDHDDMEHYSRHVASSPVGLVSLGPHRIMVLCDHRRAPILRDSEQIAWAEQVLRRRAAGVTIAVANDPRPNLLRRWSEAGMLERLVSADAPLLWLAGGYVDTPGAGGDLSRAGLTLLNLPAASATVRGGAAGRPQYRVVEISGRRVRLIGPQEGGPLTVGGLTVDCDGPNDGSATRLSLRVANTNSCELSGLRLAARLAVDPRASEVWCQGGRIEQVVTGESFSEVWVRTDVPDRGGVSLVVGSGPRPALPRIETRIELPAELTFTPLESAGLCRLVSEPPSVVIRNVGTGPAVLVPRLRLDGDVVRYRPGQAARSAAAYRIRLAPGKSVRLRPDLSVVRVRPGRRSLQVYFDGLAGCGPVWKFARVAVAAGPMAARKTEVP